MGQQWTHIDKSTWGDGPWQSEPDKKQWTDAATGLDCLAVRNEHCGHWCGYVGVPKEHPLFGASYEAPSVDVHGGLTFADKCSPDARGEGYGICHVAEREVYWFGFDCAHWQDLSPGTEATLNRVMGERRTPLGDYRDLRYIEAQCADLAAQLRALDKP